MVLGRRHRLLISVVTALALLVSGGCGDDDGQDQRGPSGPVGPVGAVGSGDDDGEIPGSGSIVTAAPDVSGFDRVVFRSEGAVTIIEGSSESLEIETDDNLLEYLQTSVVNGVLEIVTREGVDIAPSRPPVYRIAMSEITGVELDGAGSITVDAVDTEAFTVGLRGVGDVTVDSVKVTDLEVDLEGVGSITLTGTADRAEIAAGGVGIYDGSGLSCRLGTVTASGMGEATVWVTEELDATASDSGSIAYYGSPTVTEDTSSLGTVTALGDK